MTELNHLLESIHPIALANDKERILHLSTDRWIDYPRAAFVMQRLGELLATPARTRMPCLLIHGDSGMGKTMLIEKFIRNHPPSYNKQRGLEQIEIVAMEMPPAPTERRIYGKLLEALGAPFRPAERLDVLEHATIGVLERLQPKLIVVDELHHLTAATARDQRVVLNLLKHLSNTLRCCIVALGIHDAVLVIQSDAQIASRFARLELPRWRESDDLRRFVNALEKTLPLRERSNLANRDSVNLILAAGDGITGGMTEFVVGAAKRAIRIGQEKITPVFLESLLRAEPTLVA